MPGAKIELYSETEAADPPAVRIVLNLKIKWLS